MDLNVQQNNKEPIIDLRAFQKHITVEPTH